MATSLKAVDSALNVIGLGRPPAVRQAMVATGARTMTAYLTAAVAKTSDTTLAAVSELAWDAETGRRYKFRYVLPSTANAAGGTKFDIAGGSATASSVVGVAQIYAAAAVAVVAQAALNTALGATAANVLNVIEGQLTCSANGTVVLQFAQNASNGAASTLLAGGFVEVTDITV